MRGLYGPAGGAGGRSRDRDRRRSGHAPSPSLDDLWPGYLEDGYFDDQGHLRLEYVAREKVEPLVREMCSQRPGLTTHQIRRYFGHCRALEMRLRHGAAPWPEIRPLIHKMDAAAADGAAKQSRKIPELFHTFVRRNVAAIRTRKDFLEGFVPHFEAVVGFGQRYFKDRS